PASPSTSSGPGRTSTTRRTPPATGRTSRRGSAPPRPSWRPEKPVHRLLVGNEGLDLDTLAPGAEGVEAGMVEALPGAQDADPASHEPGMSCRRVGEVPELRRREAARGLARVDHHVERRRAIEGLDHLAQQAQAFRNVDLAVVASPEEVAGVDDPEVACHGGRGAGAGAFQRPGPETAGGR